MATPPDAERAGRLQLIAFQGTYHNHKERMGYAAATLYVTGALGLLFARPPWSDYPPLGKCAFLALVALTAVFGFLYVLWQFLMRWSASERIEALLQGDPLWIRPTNGSLRRLFDWRRPAALASAIGTLSFMGLWAAAALVRVFYTISH